LSKATIRKSFGRKSIGVGNSQKISQCSGLESANAASCCCAFHRTQIAQTQHVFGLQNLMALPPVDSHDAKKIREIFWHTSCDTFSVARKYDISMRVQAAAEVAGINLRMGTIPLAGLRLPPRVRKIPTVRRRLPVTIIADTAQSVIIRHTNQNLGSPVTEPHPIQIQRV
jgi:hypothetical protein